MIIRPRPTILNLFIIARGSILPSILPRLTLVFALSLMIVGGHRWLPKVVGAFDGAPFALVGIALSVFLGSRNSACYDRWWEGRKAWGLFFVAARSLARKSLILREAALRARLLSMTIAFGHAMVTHLRPSYGLDRVRAALPAELHAAFAASRNGPDMILRAMAADLAAELRAGRLTDIEWQALDAELRTMSEMQSACERIRMTPVPFGYTLLLHRTAFIFCLLLPFGFVEVLGWATPLASTLVAYAIFGLDALGDELERPFAMIASALPIASIAETIEINLREALGETDLPPLPVAVDYLLM